MLSVSFIKQQLIKHSWRDRASYKGVKICQLQSE